MQMTDTANSERLVVSLGDPNVTARDLATGRLFEVGVGAKSHAEQSARFAAEAAREADMPLPGECAPNGRRYETGRGCLTKTAQRAMWNRGADPALAASEDARATAIEAVAEVKSLATVQDEALAAMAHPFLDDNTAVTKH
jgi:hypothetical protein